MDTQRYTGFINHEWVTNKELPMNDPLFDKEDYSQCPKCKAFNQYEPEHSPSDIEDVTCGNCGTEYRVSITFTMNVDTI